MIKHIINFITLGIWQKPEDEYNSKYMRWATRQIKLFILTIKGFGEHDILIRSAALTFYTLMSIVPIAALIFAVVKGFGMESNFKYDLLMTFPEYEPIIEKVLTFATDLLNHTQGGVLASVGFITLIWAVIKVFGNIERAFNHIWEVKKQRSITRKVSDYITVIFIAPMLWIISNSLTILIKTELSIYTGHAITETLYWIGSIVSMWLMFTFIYYVMPNTKVKVIGALTAGIIAGTVFQIFQIAYIFLQSHVTSYNATYGSLAALPLFLIWLQSSWQILLSGAELSFAYQNMSRYEQERESTHISYDNRNKVMIASMLTIVRNFMNDKGATSAETIAEELDLPGRIVRDVIFTLEEAGQVLPVKNDIDEKIMLYIPAKDIHRTTIFDVINSVELNSDTNFRISHITPQMDSVCDQMDKMRNNTYNSNDNIRLMDLV